MTNIMELNEHCRLCLVKDEVNIPIFEDEGDVRQVLLKITACLPVKIAKADSLPKRICDGCLYKLESFYQFWNTSVNSEKQLLQWLAETLNGDAEANLHALKQEPTDNLQTESQVYIQQQLAYQETENYGGYPEETTNYKPKKTSTKKERDREKRERERERKREEAEAEEEEEEEAPAPKRKRRAATKKPAIEIDDDDDDDEYIPPAAISKTEDDSDANDDPGDDYGGDDNASDDNADDDTEPGPSGTTKSTSDAPSKRGRKPSKVPKLTKSNVDKYWDEQFLPRASSKKKSSKPVKCVLCSKQLKNRATYKEHLKRMHANKKRLKSCKQCGMLVLNMEQHMKSHKPHVKEIQCDQCDDKFFTKDELQDHTDTVHLKVSIQCNHCEKVFTNKSAYRDHVAATTLSLMCGTCSQTFNHIESYKEHVNICAKQLHTVCDICGKQISTRNLSEHLKVHSGVKPYSCEHCGKTFAKNGTLRNHIRIHTKEKPYICSYCNKGFSQRTPLVVHMRSHTGEKPYACHLCEKRFASLSLLTIHNKNHAA